MSAEQQTVELKLTENLKTAIELAFKEAKGGLIEDGSLDPFSIICTSDGLDAHLHPGADSRAVYESVKTLLAQEMPEAYTLCYDGYVDTDAGRHDALLVEAASRGQDEAYRFALPYAIEDGTYAWESAFLFIGTATQLYPRGTKPIVSGLVALAAERQQAAEQQAAENAPQE